MIASPFLTVPARAQVAFSVEADSDYRVRGVSLSDGQPALTASIAYDDASGAYGGLNLIGVATDHSGPQPLGWVVYAGYAQRLSPGLSLDVGLTNSDVSVYLDHRYKANYTEVYAGLTHGSLSAHIYVSPKYIIGDAATVYMDLDGAIRPARNWRLFGHAGVLMPLETPAPPNPARTRFDVRAGVAREIKRCEVRLSWTATTPQPFYPEARRQSRSTVLASVAYFF